MGFEGSETVAGDEAAEDRKRRKRRARRKRNRVRGKTDVLREETVLALERRADRIKGKRWVQAKHAAVCARGPISKVPTAEDATVKAAAAAARRAEEVRLLAAFDRKERRRKKAAQRRAEQKKGGAS